MNQYPAGTIEVRGTEVPVTVNDMGRWETEWRGKELWASTKDELAKGLSEVIKRDTAKVAVQFTTRRGNRLRQHTVHGTATGIHAATGNVLVTWRDGMKEQLSRRGGDSYSVLRRLDAREVEEWEGLLRASAEARKALDQFEAPRRIHLGDAVNDAITKALAEQ